MYHDGTNSVIDNNTGRLELSSTGNVIIKPGDKKGIICREDATFSRTDVFEISLSI